MHRIGGRCRDWSRGGFTMLPSLLYAIGLGYLVAIPVASPPAGAASDLAEYEAALKKTGRDAAAHVRLALWCEAHGLLAEQRKHLTLAVLIEPRNATARGLMGLASYRGS